jgi:3-oxo-5-alpha-steroid 4-dehydrogenase 1
MELVSPATFIATFLKSPLSYYVPRLPAWYSPQTLLAALFVIHYMNRALISPLRSPSRSKAHISVTISGIAFNLMNGYIMGAYLSSPLSRIYLNPANTYENPIFYVGLTLWVLGFVGNILHDEILLDIRRKAKSKGKGKAGEDSNSNAPQSRTQEYYGIPQGWLYNYISYPNYFCEWIEWFGFALASAPFPLTPSSFSVASLISSISPRELISVITQPAHVFAPQLTPPYVFLIAEILAMLPRALRGHQWYKTKFEGYPKGRKAVVPFLL